MDGQGIATGRRRRSTGKNRDKRQNEGTASASHHVLEFRRFWIISYDSI